MVLRVNSSLQKPLYVVYLWYVSTNQSEETPAPSRQIHADSLKNLLEYLMLSTDQETEFSQRKCIKSILSLENVY